MKKHIGLASGFFLLLTCLPVAAAQDHSSVIMQPAKVLVVIDDLLKPSAEGSVHQQTKGAFLHALMDAKWPQHYLTMDSLSGSSRTLFLIGYDSFADWEKDMQATGQNATLSAALAKARAADARLLESHQMAAYVYRPDLSLRAPVDTGHMHYFEITRIRTRPGHLQDWTSYIGMYMREYEKIPNAHWAAYEEMYGNDSGGVYLVITPIKSLAEVDRELTDYNSLHSGMSPDQKRKMRDLAQSSVESGESFLFMVDSKMSYVPDSWIKADPSFWGQR